MEAPILTSHTHTHPSKPAKQFHCLLSGPCAHSVTHLSVFSYSLMHPSIRPVIHASVQSSIHLSSHPSNHPCIHPIIPSLLHPIIHSSIYQPIHPIMHSFVDLAIHPACVRSYCKGDFPEDCIGVLSSNWLYVAPTGQSTICSMLHQASLIDECRSMHGEP